MWKYTAFAVCGVLLALASLVPETLLSVITCVAMAMTLVWAVQHGTGVLRGFYLFGLIFTLIAFYWLPSTVALFGGFPQAAAMLIFLLFAMVSALQFLLCGWLYLRLRRSQLNRLRLALPLAWLVSEFLFPRLFPWQVGHSLAAVSSIAGAAEFVGVYPLSALILWWGELGYWIYRSLEDKRLQYPAGLAAAAACTVLAVISGSVRNDLVAAALADAPEVKAALVQGNLSTEEKGNLRFLNVNIERYRRLSRQAEAEGAELLIWPESVMNRWMPEGIEQVRGSDFDPFPGTSLPLLYGGLSYSRRPDEEVRAILERHPSLNTPELVRDLSVLQYNSAFGVTEDGEISGRYYKRVLMPFGEYVPLAESFPQLRSLSPQTGNFASGKILTPIELNAGGEAVKAGLLICYEDLVPGLSREAVREGANMLVNLTNDAWYGDTAAPYQHHLLALWRAIETRRYLLRVTNTGYTGVVDPFGKTVDSLPVFKEGYLVYEVKLLADETVYVKFGDAPVWVLVFAALIAAVLPSKSKSDDEVV